MNAHTHNAPAAFGRAPEGGRVAAAQAFLSGHVDTRAWWRRWELGALMVLTGTLNLWALSHNGWANVYYSAAVRSMSSSWHDFLFASLDRSGVMTVDKPPLALWIQALSVRAFGYHSLSVLVPQALEGMASVVLVYDIVARRFGRLGGTVGGLAFALMPITVATSRHNNPDALLVLCCVAALWFTLRGLERGRTRELVLAGVMVGLGFETKMLVALVVVPGIVLAWLWLVPAARGLGHALRQLVAGGFAMVLVAGAWPLLVELTPSGDRPWISGTANNTVLSLIFEYNGLGRVEGQAGGPGGGGGNVFGGTPGPLRLLNSALGGQAGWLLGLALATGLVLLASSRLRRSDARSGWLLVVGGAALTTAVLFSGASGIFHPYYVSLLAPFVAALVGAGISQLLGGAVPVRIAGPLVVLAGVLAQLVILGDYSGQLSWLVPVLISAAVLASLALVLLDSVRARVLAVAGASACLLIAPSSWAVDTLGYATSSTFPSGGPQSLSSAGFGGPGPGGARFGRGGRGAPSFGGRQLFGNGEQPPPGAGGPTAVGASPPSLAGQGGGQLAASGPGAGGVFVAPLGNSQTITAAISYTDSHGGGTLAVSSQSSAAQAIISQDAEVAGIGGFSGRESDVSVTWLAHEVALGKVRWVLDEQDGTGSAPRLAGDTRPGSEAAISAAAKVCTPVTLGLESNSSAPAASTQATLYGCSGRAGALSALARR